MGIMDCNSPVTLVADLLLHSGFASHIESMRSVLLNSWEPWVLLAEPANGAESRLGSEEIAHKAVALLHRGAAVPASFLDQGTAQALVRLGLCCVDEGRLVPGLWQLSAFRGLLIAAQGGYGGSRTDVHLGEDSLRFAEFIFEQAPRGDVLDVGCGSGISTAALLRTADSVDAIDVLDRACAATTVTTTLNGGADRCRVVNVGFEEMSLERRYSAVVANLPGVPVPEQLPYPIAGDGGPDGLRLIRNAWSWFAENDPGDELVMRFQSLGAATCPAALADLAALFPDRTVTVVTDSAVPVEVRDAITAERISGLTGFPAQEVLKDLVVQRAAAGMTHFYSCSLTVRRQGQGGVTHVRANFDFGLHRRARGTSRKVAEHLVAAMYVRRLRQMPDEFWSVHGEEIVSVILASLQTVTAQLQASATPAEAAAELLRAQGLSTASGSIRSAGAALAVAALSDTLAHLEVLEPLDAADAVEAYG
ncbi:MAG: 50S ribosomal protein L11 methyltransferase [Acidimicrobiales bacterium]